MSTDQEHRVAGTPVPGSFTGQGEPWATLAALEEARLAVRLRDITCRWALAGIRHRACANTWGMDTETARWWATADALGREVADLQAQLAASRTKRTAQVPLPRPSGGGS